VGRGRRGLDGVGIDAYPIQPPSAPVALCGERLISDKTMGCVLFCPRNAAMLSTIVSLPDNCYTLCLADDKRREADQMLISSTVCDLKQ